MSIQIPSGEDIAAVRKGVGFTQEELATAAGLSQPMVARIENEDVDLTLESLDKICSVLGHHSGKIDDELSKALPEAVQSRRQRIELTQQQLADRAGVSQPMIARIENRDVNPKVSTVRDVITALNHNSEDSEPGSGSIETDGEATPEDVLGLIQAEFQELSQ